jgi:hypothetical protein
MAVSASLMVLNLPLPSLATTTSGVSVFLNPPPLSTLRSSSDTHAGTPSTSSSGHVRNATASATSSSSSASNRRSVVLMDERKDAPFSMSARALLVSSFPSWNDSFTLVLKSPSGKPSMHVSWCAITALSQIRSWYPCLATSSTPLSVRFRSALASSKISLQSDTAAFTRGSLLMIRSARSNACPIASPITSTAVRTMSLGEAALAFLATASPMLFSQASV